MQKKLVSAVAWKRFPELLQRPVGCRMRGHVKVSQVSGSNLESTEYIHDAEAGRYGDEEVASYNPVRMIAEEC
jgi:hypothetical protein